MRETAIKKISKQTKPDGRQAFQAEETASRKDPKQQRASVFETLESQSSWKAASRSESNTDEAEGIWLPDHTGSVA